MCIGEKIICLCIIDHEYSLLHVAAPVILTNPVATSVPIDAEASFSCVVFAGEGNRVVVNWNIELREARSTTVLGSVVNSTFTFNVTDSFLSNFDGVPEFYCYAQYISCAQVVSSSAANLTILPNIITPPQDELVTTGDNITLSCNATSFGSTSITWTGPSGALMGDQVTGDEVSSSLTLTGVDSNDGGEYTCTATNEVGTDSSAAIVYVRPVVTPDQLTAARDQMVSFNCIVQDSPMANISWEKMDEFGDFTPLNVSDQILELTVEFGDMGVYRCVVSTALFGVLNSSSSLLTGELGMLASIQH